MKRRLIITIIFIALVASAVVVFNHQNQKNNEQSKNQNAAQSDPSDGGKYLYIKEWGVRSLLPSNLQGKVTYVLGEVTADPDNNMLQNAKAAIASSALSPNTCVTSASTVGLSVDSGAQYIRSQTSKPFDSSRYRFIFKENILVENGYSYHLNYVTPPCIGDNSPIVESLQSSLSNLKPI